MNCIDSKESDSFEKKASFWQDLTQMSNDFISLSIKANNDDNDGDHIVDDDAYDILDRNIKPPNNFLKREFPTSRKLILQLIAF